MKYNLSDLFTHVYISKSDSQEYKDTIASKATWQTKLNSCDHFFQQMWFALPVILI